MVCLWFDGGGLTVVLQDCFSEASRRHSQGDVVGALDLCRQIVAQDLRNPDALHLMGVIAQQRGNAGLALKLIEAAIASRPEFAAAWYDHGHILQTLGRFDEALTSARHATEIEPELAEAWDLAALLLARTSAAPGEAAGCHLRALALRPDHPRFLGNYAAFLFGRGEVQQACTMACRAEQIDPAWPPMVLGNSLKAMGYPELAARRYARTRELLPALTEATVSEAAAYLQIGAWRQGWALWAARPNLDPAFKALPAWDGTAKARVVLYEDQGMGDAIHFARYIPWLAARAEIVAVCLRAPLRRLFADQFPALSFIDEATPLPDAARVRLSDLPFFAGTTLATIPAVPYLAAAATLCAEWRQRFSGIAGPRIGLVWAGNPRFRNDAARSLPPALLAPLMELGPHFVSLQTERGSVAGDVTDAAPFLTDFAETAAAVAELDLVIAVDTATAHLAGALGKPVFILLAFDNDWRWLVGREDSPWYPSARLFRQTRPGDWRGVIAAVTAATRAFIQGDQGALVPAAAPDECLRQNPYALALPL